MTDYSVTPDMAARKLEFYIAARRPCFLWGMPGIGKSDIVAQASRTSAKTLIDVRAAQLDAVDLRGVPFVQDGRTKWALPDFLPYADRDGADGILFLDELNAAAPSVMVACYQLILNRRLGDYLLPDGWSIIAAGNRQSDRAAAQRMPSALANRFAHIDVVPSVDAWCAWANKAGINAAVVAFLRFRPELIHKMEGTDLRAFPSPRSWAAAADFAEAPDDMRMGLFADNVGIGAAAELEGFLRIYRGIPSIADIIANPDGVTVPNDPATLYAVTTALARKADRKNLESITRFSKRALPREFNILLMVDAVKRDPTLCETSAFIAWAGENQDVTL